MVVGSYTTWLLYFLCLSSAAEASVADWTYNNDAFRRHDHIARCSTVCRLNRDVDTDEGLIRWLNCPGVILQRRVSAYSYIG